MGLRTPLYDWHLCHGARMVDFGGWDMPVQFAGIVEEHSAVRQRAGLFDVSHMGRLTLRGSDTLALIQNVFTNNAATMKAGQVRYGLVCNEAGGILDDVLVYRWPEHWSMVVNASNRDKIVAWLDKQRERRNVEIVDETIGSCMIAVQGPAALEVCRGLTSVDAGSIAYYHAVQSTVVNQPAVVSRTGYTGEDGLEFIVSAPVGVQLWQALVERGAVACGLGARDTLRLEAAMPLYGHELDEQTDPLQAGLSWAVKPEKGPFIGRDAIAARVHDAQRPVRVGLILTGKRIAREGASVVENGKEIGRVTSGTFAPTLQQAICMAYVPPSNAKPGTALHVDVRGKTEAAQVTPLPFYRRARPDSVK